MADDVPNYHDESEDFTYQRLNVSDFGQDKGISRVFHECFQFLEEAKAAKKPVLVHCAAGANRSATVVIALMMHSQDFTLLEAWNHVKKRRSVVPLTDNRLALLEFERARKGGVGNSVSEFDFLRM